MASENFPNLKGTIFIVTYGRSGSTLLQSLLQLIPGAHIVGENYNALEGVFYASRPLAGAGAVPPEVQLPRWGIAEGLFQAVKRVRKARKTWGKKEHPKNHPWYNIDNARPARFEQGMVDLFVQEVIAPPPDVRWYGFKEIRFAPLGEDFGAFLAFHRRNFPNAFFVFNSRNSGDVAKSAWWKNKPRNEVIAMVRKMDARFALYAQENPEHSHHVFYEETLKNPASLQPLFDKLDEPLDLAAAEDIMGQRLTH